jgi:hypothetical protein
VVVEAHKVNKNSKAIRIKTKIALAHLAVAEVVTETEAATKEEVELVATVAVPRMPKNIKTSTTSTPTRQPFNSRTLLLLADLPIKSLMHYSELLAVSVT